MKIANPNTTFHFGNLQNESKFSNEGAKIS